MASSEPSLIAEASSEHGVEATLYSDHVMYVRFPRGIVVDVEVARGNRDVQQAVADGPYVVVAEASELAYFDREAREFLATDRNKLQLAIAVIVGARISKYVVERWQADHDIDRPVATFHDPAKAFDWARKQALELVPDSDRGGQTAAD